MSLLHRSRKALIAVLLMAVLVVTTACSGVAQTDRTSDLSTPSSNVAYQQLERGTTSAGQSFGDWVVQTGRGLISDAYIRDDNKLGAVITSQVRPNEVRPLARSLAQGFSRNFPNRDLMVLMYAPDKKLILTARYDHQTKQIEYEAG